MEVMSTELEMSKQQVTACYRLVQCGSRPVCGKKCLGFYFLPLWGWICRLCRIFRRHLTLILISSLDLQKTSALFLLSLSLLQWITQFSSFEVSVLSLYRVQTKQKSLSLISLRLLTEQHCLQRDCLSLTQITYLFLEVQKAKFAQLLRFSLFPFILSFSSLLNDMT